MLSKDSDFSYAQENGLIELTDVDLEGGSIIKPDLNDLVRLHKIVRKNKYMRVLEFGVGFSTLIIADALKNNKELRSSSFGKSHPLKGPDYKVYSVDASEFWIKKLSERIPTDLEAHIDISYSEVMIGEFCGQLCHYYQKLPDIVPDFIYLDGPDPRQVKGTVHGLSFENCNRTPMAADILLYESTLFPSTLILVDGRTNNARFLERNLSRKYEILWDQDNDVTTFELLEPPLSGATLK